MGLLISLSPVPPLWTEIKRVAQRRQRRAARAFEHDSKLFEVPAGRAILDCLYPQLIGWDPRRGAAYQHRDTGKTSKGLCPCASATMEANLAA